MDKIKISAYNNMRKITNLKKRENKQKLLKESGFKNIQDAKKALGMHSEKADIVYQQLMENYNNQLDAMKKNLQSEIKKDIRKVKGFNNDDKSVTIKNMNPKR